MQNWHEFEYIYFLILYYKVLLGDYCCKMGYFFLFKMLQVRIFFYFQFKVSIHLIADNEQCLALAMLNPFWVLCFGILKCMRNPVSPISLHYGVSRWKILNCLYALFLHRSLISKLTLWLYWILLRVEGIVHHTTLCA